MAVADEATPDPSSVVIVSAPQQAVAAAQEETREYWTQERRDGAQPLDVMTQSPPTGASGQPAAADPAPSDRGDGIVYAEPVAPRQSSTAQQTPVQGAPVPWTLGRLFFTTPEGDSSCTASATAGAGDNTVITAGHCIHPGAGGSAAFYRNFAFFPRYYQGPSAQGAWTWARAATFQGWSRDGDFRWDQAFIKLHPQNGQEIVSAVGGNGLVGGAGKSQNGNRVWGYPAEPPFDGSVPYYCDGNATSAGLFSSDSQMSCGMNGGASGGPWLRDRIDANLGYTWAVTSRCAANDAGACTLTYLYAAPNPLEIFTLQNEVSGP